MTVEYAGDDFNELTAFFRWRGTVFSTVLCSPAIWVLMLLHCTFLYMHTRLDLDLGMIVKGAAPDEISTVSINLLIIFLVYYGGNCYSRYFEMYEQCMAMAGDVACWVGLCRVYFPQANADILWNLSRHMVAHHVYTDSSDLPRSAETRASNSPVPPAEL
jgi:hypothetical protein